MAAFTIAHQVPCSAERFWKTFFDRDFNVELYLRELGFPAFTIDDQRETDTLVTRRISAQPKMEVPAALQRLFGTGFGYTEEGSLSRAEGVWRFRSTPSTMADKLTIGGAVRLEPAGEGRVRRIVEMTVAAKVFGVGGLIESASEKQLREAWAKSAAFMERYLAR